MHKSSRRAGPIPGTSSAVTENNPLLEQIKASVAILSSRRASGNCAIESLTPRIFPANGVANAFQHFFVGDMTSSSTRGATAGGIYSGDVGFRPKFQDTPNGKRSYDDQTHHFAEYFYTGYYATESWKAYLHSLTDFNNQGDLNLGSAAFEMGLSMRSRVIGSRSHVNRNNPRLVFTETLPVYENYQDRLKRIYAIPDRILNEICD